MDRRANTRKIRRYVVLETVLANVVEQLLHFRNFHHASAAESVQRIIGKAAFADVTAHLTRRVVGGETGKAHLLGLDQANDRPVSVLFSYGAGNDLLQIYF